MEKIKESIVPLTTFRDPAVPLARNLAWPGMDLRVFLSKV